MVSGFHRAQHRSASLFLYLSFIHSLSPFVSLFFFSIPHSIVSLCSYTPTSLFSPRLLLLLSSFFHPIHCFCSCNLHASFLYQSLSLPLSLPPSIYLSLPQQAQSYISGVDQIFQAHMDSTDRHKSWVFWSAHAGFFSLLVVSRKNSVEPVYEIPPFYLQFHTKSLSLTFLYKVSTLYLYRLSHSLTLCLSSWASSICVNTNASSKPSMS